LFTIISPQYLPSLNYFINLTHISKVIINDYSKYHKSQKINRSQGDGILIGLSIPLSKGNNFPLSKKTINPDDTWKGKHLKFIYHRCYNFPYFDYFYPEFSNILMCNSVNLYNLLKAFFVFYCNYLQLKVKATALSNFHSESLEDAIKNFAQKENDQQFIYSSMDVKFINPASLINEKIRCYEFLNLGYYSNISTLEFLFRFGPEAPYILRDLNTKNILTKTYHENI